MTHHRGGTERLGWPCFIMAPMKAAIFVWVVLFACTALAGPAHVSRIIVDRSSRTMTLEFPDGKNEHYRVSLGRAGPTCSRTRTGDDCTPTGSFFIASKRPSQRFHKFLLLSYPDANAAKHGLETKLITQAQFDGIQAALNARRTPPQSTALGGDIGIHGQPGWLPSFLSSIVSSFNWTAACISVTDAEIDHIYDLVDVGTPVLIR